MYKFVVVTDPDTSPGFRLAGVEAYDAAGPGQAKELLASLSAKEGIGIVAVSEELLDGLDEKFRDRMERLRRPIVIAIPSRLKNVDRRLYIERLLRKAIGYNIVMRGERMITGKISRISGPVLLARGMKGSKMYDVVNVGDEALRGEIIRLEGEVAVIQMYEDTTGLMIGEPVVNTERPLSVELGPGLISSIYDGIQRPLPVLFAKSGDFISRGITVPAWTGRRNGSSGRPQRPATRSSPGTSSGR